MLHGVSVLVAGAGLAGLTAARDLVTLGATVTVIDARDRVGGRVFTVRNGFAGGQHGEAGGDTIDASHSEIRELAAELGLTLVQVLKAGWAYARPDEHGVLRRPSREAAPGWPQLAAALETVIRAYRLAECRWDTPIALAIGRKTVSQWLDESHADSNLRDAVGSLRSLFLAEPDELSLIGLVHRLAVDAMPAVERTYRIVGGNDQLAAALAAPLGDRLRLGTELAAISIRGQKVRASLKHKRQTQQLTCDYLVCTLPASVLRRIPITPALPAQQHEAIAALPYGRATKSLLQFSSRFWRVPGTPAAFATPMPFGSVWDANEEQRGKPAMLSMLAGGSASDATIELIGRDGTALERQLEWLGSQRAQLLASHHVSWENDPLARGGYAFFDPGFRPELRRWLAQPCERLCFAGEHTSLRWQGSMNGAVETGRRAAAEVAALSGMAGSARPSRRRAAL